MPNARRILLVCLLLATSAARAEEPRATGFGWPTLGGGQFWGDVQFFHDLHIQRNVFTGHYRLLNGANQRLESGSLGECREELARVARENRLPKMSGKAVILVHGILRSAKSFDAMAEKLRAADYLVIGFNYPSTRVSIPAAADYLRAVMQSLEGIERIDFVVHSMGGLIVRAYLDKHQDPRCKRMVMLGVPNCGAEMADLLENNPLFKLVWGPAGQQLGAEEKDLIAKLPTPKFEFAILAGSRGTEDGYNPLIDGDDDGTLTVACTRLPGAADFATVHCLHSFLPSNEKAIAATLRFLQTGRLRAEGPPRPIRK